MILIFLCSYLCLFRNKHYHSSSPTTGELHILVKLVQIQSLGFVEASKQRSWGRIGKLSLTIESASGISAADKSGTSDPYVTVNVGSCTRQTSVKFQTLEPVWDELFEFNVDTMDETVVLDLYDKDVLSRDDFLGACPLGTIRQLLSVHGGELAHGVTVSMKLVPRPTLAGEQRRVLELERIVDELKTELAQVLSGPTGGSLTCECGALLSLSHIFCHECGSKVPNEKIELARVEWVSKANEVIKENRVVGAQ